EHVQGSRDRGHAAPDGQDVPLRPRRVLPVHGGGEFVIADGLEETAERRVREAHREEIHARGDCEDEDRVCGVVGPRRKPGEGVRHPGEAEHTARQRLVVPCEDAPCLAHRDEDDGEEVSSRSRRGVARRRSRPPPHALSSIGRSAARRFRIWPTSSPVVSPVIPCGRIRNTRTMMTRAIIGRYENETPNASWSALIPRFSANPTMKPPATVPQNEVKPPRIEAANSHKRIPQPISGVPGTSTNQNAPPRPARPPARSHVNRRMFVVLMPATRARSKFDAIARIPFPIRVRVNSR